MKVSFDFDGCLGDSHHLCSMVLSLHIAGDVVLILTSRIKNNSMNKDLLKLVKLYHIKHVIYSPNTPKLHYIKKHDIDLHFDDDPQEVAEINNYYRDKGEEPRAVLVNYPRI